MLVAKNQRHRLGAAVATYGMDQELIEALTQRHIDMSDPTIAALLTQGEPTQVPDLRAEAASELHMQKVLIRRRCL